MTPVAVIPWIVIDSRIVHATTGHRSAVPSGVDRRSVIVGAAA